MRGWIWDGRGLGQERFGMGEVWGMRGDEDGGGEADGRGNEGQREKDRRGMGLVME